MNAKFISKDLKRLAPRRKIRFDKYGVMISTREDEEELAEK
jgi:hypothetical protein